jgi:hypothetical protein
MLRAGVVIDAGEMVVFEQGETPITVANTRDESAVFVPGSAVPHSYELHLDNYSVHTSGEALATGASGASASFTDDGCRQPAHRIRQRAGVPTTR